MLNVDEKAMAYCLIEHEVAQHHHDLTADGAQQREAEALFAAGLLNLPTYQNFLRMKREQEKEEPPAKAS